jgi:hypothetical protein
MTTRSLTMSLTAVSAIGQAEQIIAAKVLNDGRWHSAAAVYETALANGIGVRTVQRAAAGIGLQRRRRRQFPAGVEWRWPVSFDTPAARAALDRLAAEQAVLDALDQRPRTRDTRDTHDRQGLTNGLQTRHNLDSA